MAARPKLDSINGLAICAGAGGIELGLQDILPYRTVCYVEKDSYAAANLVARMEKKDLEPAPIWDDITTFDSIPWCGKVDFITAGYPCQPFSTLGKRQGKDDPRWLWDSIREVILDLCPFGIFIENVSAHIRRGFDTVSEDLEKMGYKVKAGLFTAHEVGALHRRERMFALAYASSTREWSAVVPQGQERLWANLVHDSFQAGRDCPICYAESQVERFADKSGLARIAHGVPNRVDRARLAGNAVMPQMAACAFLNLNSAFLV